MKTKLKEYINGNWDACIKFAPEDDGTLIGLPYPYTVPAVGRFDEMYYWDTYFTNKGLLIDGRAEQVKYNTDNMLYLVEKYGFMPNGNRTNYLNASQPPFLSLMVADVYEYYKDTKWLDRAYDLLKVEYNFWDSERNSKIGLAHYDGRLEEASADRFINHFEGRVGFKFPEDRTHVEHHCRATGECGWDVSPRFETAAHHFAALDLNSLLYIFEKTMAYFSQELKKNEESHWEELAQTRKERVLKYCQTEDGLLLDYNFETESFSPVFSAASFFPMFAELADKKQAEAVVENLHRLEAEYGLLTCEETDMAGNYQWGHPNGWACLQYIAIIGLENYGYHEEALRLANKYTTLVEKVFAETGNLWEKYNVVEGNINVTNEYEMPAMMGWSAGVYLACDSFR